MPKATPTAKRPAPKVQTRMHGRNATICLCMMVKNEAPIVGRALESALPWVDTWCVVDTGSEDGTKALVMKKTAGLRGQLVEHPWHDFAANRTAAVEAARQLGADYILMMDADQTLQVIDPDCLQNLSADVYNLLIKHGDISYPHPWLLKASLPWRWMGETHEYLACDVTFEAKPLTGIALVEHSDSHRRLSGNKAREDRELLERAYADDPSDGRTIFYLGQLCQDEGNIACAMKWYTQRVEMGGWTEEVFVAQYRLARLFEAGGQWGPAVMAYLQAYQLLPLRAESLFRVANGYFLRHHFALARLYFEEAAAMPKPAGSLFVEDAIYDYAAAQGYAWSCRALARHEDAEEIEKDLLAAPATPAAVMAAILDARQTKTFGPLTK
jgi:tetratricopeptide (TPR) repeat protein